jgi:hypothetical protein
MEGVFHLRTYRTRNTGTSSRFDYITTGTRTSLSRDAGIYLADWVLFWQGHAHGGVCSRVAAETPRGAVDQEACKERLFTAKSRDYQRSQEGKERGERSRWWGNHHAHSPDAVRFLYSNLGVSRSVPTLMPPGPSPPDRIRPTSSRNNCRSWRRCRPSRNSASASSRSGNPRGQVAQPASQKYRLCRKYLLDIWSRVPYNPISLSVEGSTNSFFSFRRCCGYLAHEIHTIHPSIILALLSSRHFFGFLIYYNRCPFSLSHDLTITHTHIAFFVFVCLF